MTPGEQRTLEYDRAISTTKMAERFLSNSNGGREGANVRQAIKNLSIALNALDIIEKLNENKKT